MAEGICASCHDTLYFDIELDSEDEDSKAPANTQSVPDDVELTCGCHFHWWVEIAYWLNPFAHGIV